MNRLKSIQSRIFTPKYMLLGMILALVIIGVSFMLSAPSNSWDSEKNQQTLFQKASFEGDCPLDKIEVVEKYNSIKAYKLNVCGKTFKYQAVGGGLEKITWKRVK